MYLISYVLALALFWTGTMADMCYQCVQIVKESDPINPASCPGGKFDNRNLPEGVSIKDCGMLGCSKGTIGVEATGYKSYSRDCGTPQNQENKCYDVSSYIPQMPTNNNGQHSRQELCVCHGDYCNGAVRMNSQAILGLIASVITIIVMQY